MASQQTTILNNQSAADAAYTGGNTATQVGGKLRVISDTYTTTSAVTTSETLSLCKVPAGAKVLKIEIYFPASAGPSGQSLLGVSSDTDKYGRMNNVNAAAGLYTALGQTGADYDNVTTTEETIIFTPVGASLATGLLLHFAVYYVTE